MILWLKQIKQALKYYWVGLFGRFDEHHVFLFGGALAFSIFLCIVPLVLIVFSILGNILESGSLERQIGAMISKMIPYSDSAAFVKRVISSRIEEVVTYKELAGYLGAVGLLFAASGLFSTMRTILNRVYNIHPTTSVVLGKLKDVGMVLLVVILIPLFITVLPFFEMVLDLASRFALLKFLRFGGFQKLVLAVGSLLSIFTLFGLVYYFIPNKTIGLRTAAISALSASVLWEIAKQGFGFYIKHFATLGRIYGVYILLVVVAFWIYYSSLVFIIGAEIGQLYRERSMA